MKKLVIEVWINGPTDMHGNYQGDLFYDGHRAGYISAEPEAWMALEKILAQREETDE